MSSNDENAPASVADGDTRSESDKATAPPAGAPAGDAEPPYPPIGYAWYVVGVLTLVYVFSFIDRMILSYLVTPIKEEFSITDTQMSYLGGLSFALFYTLMGIPIGRWVDSGSRRGLIAGGFVLWSAMTALCGKAANYIQLLLCRVGVGVGEAALSPAAYSLITDYFPKNRLATAISVYSMGIYIGSGVASIVSGVLVHAVSNGATTFDRASLPEPPAVVVKVGGTKQVEGRGTVRSVVREVRADGSIVLLHEYESKDATIRASETTVHSNPEAVPLTAPEMLGLKIVASAKGDSSAPAVAPASAVGASWSTAVVGTMTLPLFGEVRPWQLVFFIVGVPGIPLALLMLSVKEPVRRGLLRAKAAGAAPAKVPMSEVARYVGLNWKTFVCHTLGFAMLSFSSYGTSSWIPAFFERTYGWDKLTIGWVFGTLTILAGSSGIVFGGVLADRMSKKGRIDAKMMSGFLAAVIWFPFGMLFPLMESPWVCTLLLFPAVFFASMPFGVAPAAIQEVMPNQMRGQASAIYMFVINLIGLGVGPSAVAWCTDYYFKDVNDLRYSLLIVTTIAHVIAGVLLWVGLRPFRDSVARVKALHAA